MDSSLFVSCRWYPATVVGMGHKGQHVLLYDDGEHDSVTLARERVQWVGPALAPVQAGLPAGGILLHASCCLQRLLTSWLC